MRVCSLDIKLERLVWSALAVALIASHAGAQTKAGASTGVVTGLVKDENDRPIPDVEVTLLKTAVSVRTDTAGLFTIPRAPAGSLDISFRRLAFAPVLLIMQVAANDTTDVEVTLSVVAQKLTGVIVLADPDRRRVIEAFETRRKQGIGHFITRAEIEKRHPMLLSDMVRMIPGTRVIADNGRTNLRFARVGGMNCPPQFFIDGMQATGFTIDDMPPGDVEGVELYAGRAGLPAEYNRLRSTVSCGAVIIWTRIPGNEKTKPSSPY